MIFSDPASADPKSRAPEAERTGFSFSIDEPVSVVSPAVFASPHSGRLYPKGFLEACTATTLDLRRIEDAYVDRLLADVHESGSPVICGLVGRAFVDLNRAESEMDPAMFVDPSPSWFSQRSPRVDAGLGCIPRVAHNGTPIYSHKLRLARAMQEQGFTVFDAEWWHFDHESWRRWAVGCWWRICSFIISRAPR